MPTTAAGSAEAATEGGPSGHATGADDGGLRVLVGRHRTRDERERAAKSRFLAELDRLERPFDRHADPVHVTASAVVAGKRGTVLHLHRRLGRWLQPGGHVDAGESAPQAAQREAWEETGLDVAHPEGGPTLLHLDVHPAADDHVHLDLRYLLLAPDREPRPGPGESPDVEWFSWEDAEEIADEALVGALRVARKVLHEGPRRDC
ncbi:MAG: NUDIX hydrolase [Acidimicrobiales bacterium]